LGGKYHFKNFSENISRERNRNRRGNRGIGRKKNSKGKNP